MTRKSTLLLFLAITAFSVISQAEETDIIINGLTHSCSQYQSTEYCQCEAYVWYGNLTDRQKGFFIIGFELESSNSGLSQKEIGEVMFDQYDPDGSIRKELIATTKQVKEIVKRKCSVQQS